MRISKKITDIIPCSGDGRVYNVGFLRAKIDLQKMEKVEALECERIEWKI